MFGSGDLGMGVTFTLRDQASQNAQNAGNSISSLDKVVAKAANNISQAASKLTSGIVATVAAVTLLIGPFLSSVEAGMEFNFQISRAGAISRATAEEIIQLKDAALSLGISTMYTATEVAKTEVVLAQAGYAVRQQLEMLPDIMNLATAGVVGLDYAASVASDTLFQFGLATKDMGRISDVIVQSANMSNMSVENFGNAMRYFGPQARLFDLSLEESAGYIEMMANSGMRGSIATRAFGTALAEFARPTKMAQQALIEMFGTSSPFWNAEGKFVGLINMTRMLQDALRGMTDQQILNKLARSFNLEAIQEISQLLKLEFHAIENGVDVVYRGADALQYFTEKNREAGGIAAIVAKEMMDNLKGDTRLLTSAFETMKIEIENILDESGMLRKFVQWVRSLVLHISALMNTQLGKWIVQIGAVVAVATSGLLVMGFAIGILIPAMWSMVAASAALFLELSPFIAVGTTIVASIMAIKNAWDEFQDTQTPATGFMGMLQKIGATVAAVAQIFTSWNGKTFTLSESLQTSLSNLGILDFVLNLSTWIVRIKEFFYGIIEGATFMYAVMEALFKELTYDFNRFTDSLNDLGIPLGKLGLKLDIVRGLGIAVAASVMDMMTPFVILLKLLTLIVETMEFLIVNWKEVAKLALTGGIGFNPASWINTFTKSSKDESGNLVPSPSVDMKSLLARQAELMASMGIPQFGTPRGATPAEGGTMGPARAESGWGGSMMAHIYLDSEKIAEKVVEVTQQKNARK